MAIKFRNYTNLAGITEDYYKVRAFMIKLGYSEFTYARWDWMIKHINLDQSALDKIGLWEENDEIVGIAILTSLFQIWIFYFKTLLRRTAILQPKIENMMPFFI